MSVEEENKALVRRVVSLLEQNDEAVWQLHSPDYVEHHPDRDVSLEETKKSMQTMWDAFRNSVATIEHLVAEGDKVAYRVIWRTTHTGKFMGIPPTGKTVEMTNTGIFRIADGKITEWWGTPDNRLMQQLGVSPLGG